MNNRILENLNPAQKEAVTWPAGPLLILAGAGSGKTRILTHRIVYLIAHGVPHFQILGVTFTNKAAAEMKNRVQRLTQQDVWISTFHSTCLRILRMEGPAIGIPGNFVIYDEQDQLTMIKEVQKELGLDEKQTHPKGVRERIQRAKDFLQTPYQYAEKAQDYYEETVARVYMAYEKKMTELGACDFGDLIMKTVFVFDQKPEVLQHWQERFQHILVDEYQDTNHAQYRLVKLLAAGRRQVTVVGDPDQSIYMWRGADIRNIMHFENDYPDCGIIKMEQNYRSTSVILDAANDLITRNEIRKPKALWTERQGGEKITLYGAADEKDEAMFVASEVLRLKKSGKTLADQVVFYRTHAQSRPIEDTLRRFGIPYKIVGGTRFYDRKEIKDLVGYMRVILFPQDVVNWKRILNTPARGLGKKAFECLETFSRDRMVSFDQAIARAGEITEIAPRSRETLRRLYQQFETWRANHREMPVEELLSEILEKSGYLSMLEEEKTIESQARIENIEEFFSVIREFKEQYRPQPGEEAMTPLAAFLESIALLTNLDTWEAGTDVLTLMTMHTAKGLEFPIVYIVGMEEGVFPSGTGGLEDPEDLEEERRLCYVGVTRAKDKLYLTYARERMLYGSRHYNLPSRFLNEMPANLLQMASGGTARPSQVRPASEVDIDDIEIEFDEEERRRRILFDE